MTGEFRKPRREAQRWGSSSNGPNVRDPGHSFIKNYAQLFESGLILNDRMIKRDRDILDPQHTCSKYAQLRLWD